MKRLVPPSSSGVPSVKNIIGLVVWPSESHKHPKRCLEIYVLNFDATPRKQFADPLTAFNQFSDATRTTLPYLHK
jgi:hypothetical protein